MYKQGWIAPKLVGHSITNETSDRKELQNIGPRKSQGQKTFMKKNNLNPVFWSIVYSLINCFEYFSRVRNICFYIQAFLYRPYMLSPDGTEGKLKDLIGFVDCNLLLSLSGPWEPQNVQNPRFCISTCSTDQIKARSRKNRRFCLHVTKNYILTCDKTTLQEILDYTNFDASNVCWGYPQKRVQKTKMIKDG